MRNRSRSVSIAKRSSLVAVAQAKVSDIDGAQETVKELGTLDNNVHPFVRPAFAEALVRVGHAEAAFKKADPIQDPFVKSRVL